MTKTTDQLKNLFNEHVTNMPCLGTAEGVFYCEPQGEKIVFGLVCNTGLIPTDEFDYDFDMSWDYNFSGMIEAMLEKYGYIE